MSYRFWGCCALAAIFIVTGASCASKKLPVEMGIESYEAEDYAGAKTHFETALTTEPENAQAVYYLGRIALQQGEIDEAVELLETGCCLRAEDPEGELFRKRPARPET
jgi:Flp pilus assembly protein TadD